MKVIFRIARPRWAKINGLEDEVLAVLRPDNWDDYGFKTTFELELIYPDGEIVEIGNVSIAYLGMKGGKTHSELDRSFSELPEAFYSLGFNDEYYWRLRQLDEDVVTSVLSGMRDLAYDIPRFNQLVDNESKEDSVFYNSVLRHNNINRVQEQLHRIATGGSRFLNFKISIPVAFQNVNNVEFEVVPLDYPPTNVHAVIGSNGVGKTLLISKIVNEIDDNVAIEATGGTLKSMSAIWVAFSPFDLHHFQISEQEEELIQFVGLANDEGDGNKSNQELVSDFAQHIEACIRRGKLGWLRRALSKLQSDSILASHPTFLMACEIDNDSNIESEREVEEIASQVAAEFASLSSGHKIVMLTLTALAAEVNEGTLVLIDEPENHLHPPLLSSFIRALSDLLSDRNGLAILGTHSPVVLQEIPKSCVWKIFRAGEFSTAERPQIETFGENVGVLTREVFGLQVRESGFYKMLAEVVDKSETYEEVVAMFKGQLGGEAKALVRVLLADKE